LTPTDRLEGDEPGQLAVEVAAVPAQMGAHSLVGGLAGAAEERVDGHRRGRLRVEAPDGLEHGGDPGGVRVCSRRGGGEGDLAEQEGGDDQDQRLGQLQSREPSRVDAGHPRPERRQEQRDRPEPDARGGGHQRQPAARGVADPSERRYADAAASSTRANPTAGSTAASMLPSAAIAQWRKWTTAHWG
jgi:hypothetical protein